MRLEGKAALVTGSSGGIGHGIAVRLAREGASVVVNYRSNEQGAEDALAMIRPLLVSGARAVAIQADTSDRLEGERLLRFAAPDAANHDVAFTTSG